MDALNAFLSGITSSVVLNVRKVEILEDQVEQHQEQIIFLQSALRDARAELNWLKAEMKRQREWRRYSSSKWVTSEVD